MSRSHVIPRPSRLQPFLQGVVVAVLAGVALNCVTRESARANRDSSAAITINEGTGGSSRDSGNAWSNGRNTPANAAAINDSTAPVATQTQPRTGANFSSDSVTSAPNRPVDNSPVLSAFGSSEEVIRGRLARLRMRYEWPVGMYPFGLRNPAPPASEGPEIATLSHWKLIYSAHALHRRREYAEAIKYLEYAAAGSENADTALVLFNLGAAYQALAATQPEKRNEAIAAFRRVLTVKPTELESRWRNECFRHFAAAALSQLLLENGQRVEALKAALESAYTFPLRDPIAGKTLPVEQAQDQLLPIVYAYAGADLMAETAEAQRRLLESGRPQLLGPDAATLVAAFFHAAAEQVVDAQQVTPNTPRCYTRPFLRALVKNWLADFPNHPKTSEVLRVVDQTRLHE